jgi:hypothetical protein
VLWAHYSCLTWAPHSGTGKLWVTKSPGRAVSEADVAVGTGDTVINLRFLALFCFETGSHYEAHL